MIELNNNLESILIELYDSIFKNLSENYIDVFLCGGASNKNSISLRDKIREKIGDKKNIRILYPEDLFIDLLNKKRNMIC